MARRRMRLSEAIPIGLVEKRSIEPVFAQQGLPVQVARQRGDDAIEKGAQFPVPAVLDQQLALEALERGRGDMQAAVQLQLLDEEQHRGMGNKNLVEASGQQLVEVLPIDGHILAVNQPTVDIGLDVRVAVPQYAPQGMGMEGLGAAIIERSIRAREDVLLVVEQGG